MLVPLLGLLFVGHSLSIETFPLNATFNLVKHLKSIEASNTCGTPKPELYCLLTGTPLAPGLDYTYSRYPGEYIDGQFCNTCNTGQHEIRNAIDSSQNNWWQSSTLATIDNQQMTVDLELGQEYQAVYFVLKAANSPRPAQWVLEKSTDYGKTYQAWQIYVATDSDCLKYYGIPASRFPVDFITDDQIICTSYYGTLNPLENGEIFSSLVNNRPGAEEFYLNESPRLQQWMKVTNVRIRLKNMQIIHSLVRENDNTANRRFFYSIREIIVAGRCSCNGHAQTCSKQPSGRIECDCEGNTCGTNCNECCPGYNLLPWQPSSARQKFQCEKCQCYGHSEECYYDAGAIGISVDVEGNVRGGAVCVDCQENTTGVNCEKCKVGYFRTERESKYSKSCKPCSCNTANIKFIEGKEFGSCDQKNGGQCYCKDGYGGRECSRCLGDYYNSLVQGLSCKVCNCNIHGTVSQLHNCADMTGQCYCKENAVGNKCGECRDRTYNLTLDNDYGCADCGCDLGGSVNSSCNKTTGQCLCRQGLTGRQCDTVKPKHYIPAEDFLSLEAEDGMMNEYQVVYDFKDNVFLDGFHGKGYATLGSRVPSVDMRVEIPQYSQYKVIITYQLDDAFQTTTGYITAKNPRTNETLRMPVTLETCKEGCNIPLEYCDDTGNCENVHFKLEAGEWIITFSHNVPAFKLDRLVLKPRLFEEPTVIYSDIHSCTIYRTRLCKEYQLHNLQPSLHDTQGFVFLPNVTIPIITVKDCVSGFNISYEDLRFNGTEFEVDEEASHSVIIDFMYNGTSIQDLTLTISDGNLTRTGYFTLHYCDELQMCRAVVRDSEGRALQYNTIPGKVKVHFNEKLEGSHPLVGRMYFVQYTEDMLLALKPHYICMRGDNGRCSQSSYSSVYPLVAKPAYKGSIVINTVDEEGNADVVTRDIDDSYIKERSNYPKLTSICGSVDAVYEATMALRSQSSKYRVVLEYFYTGLDDLDIEVEFSDGKTIVAQGLATILPCNGYSACRLLVVNRNSDSADFNTPFFSFTNRNLIIHLKEMQVGKCILLNQILVTTSQVANNVLAEPLPLVQTDDFLKYCSDPSNTSEFCEASRLTLAAEFFNGLPECGCHPQGSLSDECEVKGGQCDCKENIIGRTCDRCKAGFFGFPNCKPCPVARCSVQGSGYSSVCNEITGKCECGPNVVGERCDQCDADSYGYDGLLGCKDCNCNLLGSSGGSCDENGNCYCKNYTIVGEKCTECMEGRTNYPSCDPCNCNTAGSTGDICDTATGQCPCKDSVTGKQCHECKEGFYNLHHNNTFGCEPCFCFGVTDNCHSAPVVFRKIGQDFSEGSAQGWLIAKKDSLGIALEPIIIESARYPGLHELTISSSQLLLSLNTREFVWLSPFSGDLSFSYQGRLEFTLGYYPANIRDIAVVTPRVYVKAKHGHVYYNLEEVPSPQSYVSYSVRFEIGGWRNMRDNTYSTKEDLLGALISVEYVAIQGNLNDGYTDVTYKLVSVSLDSAYPSANGINKVTHLEQCVCPEGYSGYSCQDCTSGYYRIHNDTSTLLGYCVACDCNGHSNQCDVITGKCFDCQNNTLGDQCEICGDGYYGNPKDGGNCQLCPCPVPKEGNVFGTCDYNSDTGGIELKCTCDEGYESESCGICSSGYHGNPKIEGGSCEPCSTCNNNTDVTQDYCDRVTGDCVICLENTAGRQCEVCKDGYYGDAVVAKDCKECMCNENGSVSLVCDNDNGECTCLSHVVGEKCDECQPGYWNMQSEKGCTSCDCNINGTRNNECDSENGQCKCEDFVTGYKCDECTEGYYGLKSLGDCTACDCNTVGSVSSSCDTMTGQCNCTAGTTGTKCDICDSWAVITPTGCKECSGCSRILKDYMDELQTDISETIQLKETGGRLDKDLKEIQELRNSAVVLQSKALAGSKETEEKAVLWGATSPLISNSIRYKYNRLSGKLDQVIDKVEALERNTSKREDGMELLMQQIDTLSDEYSDTYDTLQNSLITYETIVEDPEEMEKAIETSKAKIQRMRGRVIYTPDPASLQDINSLNTSINDYDNLVRTDLDSMQSTITDLYERAGFIIKTTVKSVLTPLYDFERSSSGISADLSNSERFFVDRKKIVADTVTEGESNMKDINVVLKQLNPADSDIDDAKIDRAENIISNAENYIPTLDNFNMMTKKLMIEKSCDKVKDFLMSPAEPVSVLRKMGSFISNIEIAKAHIKNATENDAFSLVKDWNTVELDKRIDRLNTSVDMNQNIDSSLESLSNKLSNLSGRLKKDTEALSGLESRLQSVRSQYSPSRETRDTDTKLGVWVDDEYRTDIMETISELDESSARVKENVNMKALTDLFNSLESKDEKNKENMQLMMKNFDKNNLNSIPSKIKRLKSNTIVDLSDKMTALQEKMMKIKEKIQNVRNTASTVQVGMEMKIPSYVSLPVPALVQGSRYTTLSLMFKTLEPKGTLIHLRNPASSEQFMVRLMNGKVQMSFDIGEGIVAIDSEETVNDGSWHTLRASRNGQLGHFSIQSSDGKTSTYTGASPGSVDILELDTNSSFIVGARYEDGDKVDLFKGSITNLQLNNEMVGLWGYQTSKGDISPVQVLSSYKGYTPSRNGICFNGHGYAKFSGNGLELYTGRTLTISLKVQTFSSDGVLLELSNLNKSNTDPHSITLALQSGNLQLLINGKAVTTLKHKLNTGLPVNITAIINGNGKDLSLKYKDRSGKSSKSTADIDSSISWESTDIKTISLGGTEEGRYISGTIKNIKLNNIIMSLNQQNAIIYTGTSKACLPQKSLDGITFFGSGYLQYPGVSFTNNFSFRVRIRTKRPYGVIMYGTDNLGFNVISLSIDRGQIEFVAQKNFLKTVVRAGENVNDGDWKDIQVTRESSVIKLMINGYNSQTTIRENKVYATDYAFFLGGVSADSQPLLMDVVPTLLPFEGSMRMLYLNNEEFNTASFVAAKGVSLAGTTINHPDTVYQTVPKED